MFLGQLLHPWCLTLQLTPDHHPLNLWFAEHRVEQFDGMRGHVFTGELDGLHRLLEVDVEHSVEQRDLVAEIGVEALLPGISVLLEGSEERSVGNAGVSTCRTWWAPFTKTKKQ